MAVRRLRSALTAVVVAIGVLTVVTLGIVLSSIRTSALAVLQTGRADFTVSQKGVADVLNSNIDASDVAGIRRLPGVADNAGALIATTRLNRENPIFLQVGLRPEDFGAFGVTLVAGQAYAEDSPHDVLLGWRAARNPGLHVGDAFDLAGDHQRVVGIFSTGQALGDAGMMLPLSTFQAAERQPGEVTLVFVRAAPGVDVQALRTTLERNNPQLVTVRTASDFGRADRSLQLIEAAAKGTTLLAVLIGAVIVLSTTLMTYLERLREFGVLSAIGWSRLRVLTLVLAEAGVVGLVGAAVGVGLSFIVTLLLQRTPDLVGVLQVHYTTDVFWRALITALGTVTLGALYPAVRAARLSPLEALRHE
ncbi:MAG TPA: ABC transporter permease [Frankiaceae bacterium]|nr:ABC transporter permease [Frankiaceae bacterium]